MSETNNIKDLVTETIEQIGKRNSTPSEKLSRECRDCGKAFDYTDTYETGYQYDCQECLDKKRKEEFEHTIKTRISNTIPNKYIPIETDNQELFGKKYESIFISGKPGSGKTVFACSLAKKYIREGEKVNFINFPAFIMKLQCAYRNDQENPYEMAEGAAKFYGVLVIDDLGAEKLTDFVRQIIYFIINEREQRCLTTIITSNFSLGDLDRHIDSRISSRIVGMCRVVKMDGVDRRIKK